MSVKTVIARLLLMALLAIPLVSCQSMGHATGEAAEEIGEGAEEFEEGYEEGKE